MVELNNYTKTKVDKKLFEKIAAYVFKQEKKKEQDISVAVVGTARMRELNRVYRGKDYPTNVLSFKGDELGLGEIVLCPQIIRKDAVRYGITEKEEFARALVHGVLHVLGYEHEKGGQEEARMQEQERRYLPLILTL